MRLLPKSEIQAQKAKELSQAIDQGIALAKRVDRLRQVQADEEAALEKFRTVTLQKIHEETTKASQKRDSLKKEVAELQKEAEEARKPLDVEWEHVRAKAAENKDFEAKLQAREKDVEEIERKTSEERKAAELELYRYNTLRKEAVELKDQAAAERNAAHVALLDVEKTRLGIQALKEQVEKELKERDMHMAAKERDVTIREELVKKREDELKAGQKLLNDRIALLERTIKRSN